MKHHRCCLHLCCAIWLFSCGFASGQDWTRFRGPNGAGQSDAATIPVTWTTSDYNWRVKLPGKGHSSPVVWGKRIFVTSADEADATHIVRCLDTTTGGLIWKRSFDSATYSKHQFNAYDAASPLVDRHHVYVTWASPNEHVVLALDRDKGRQRWRRDLGPFVAQHGFGGSPILCDGLVIVPNDQAGKSSVVALDRITGQIRWEVDRRSKKTTYSTPCIYQPDGGHPQLILTSWAHGISSLDPRTGKRNWELEILKFRCVGSPMVAAGLIFASCGAGGTGHQMVAVRPGDPQRGIEAKVAYELKGSLPYVCTPVAHGDLLFSWCDLGVVTCLDAPTGKIHWRERIGGRFFGSPVRAADRIYCISRKGEMVVLAAADKYKLLGRISLEEPSNSTPAIAAGAMYLRTTSHLMAIGK